MARLKLSGLTLAAGVMVSGTSMLRNGVERHIKTHDCSLDLRMGLQGNDNQFKQRGTRLSCPLYLPSRVSVEELTGAVVAMTSGRPLIGMPNELREEPRERCQTHGDAHKSTKPEMRTIVFVDAVNFTQELKTHGRAAISPKVNQLQEFAEFCFIYKLKGEFIGKNG